MDLLRRTQDYSTAPSASGGGICMKGRDAERESKPRENGRNWVAWEPFMCPLLEAVGYASLLLNRAFEDIDEITRSNFFSTTLFRLLKDRAHGEHHGGRGQSRARDKERILEERKAQKQGGVRLRGERPSIPSLPSACSSSVRPSQNKRWLTNKDAALTGIVGARLTETKEELERICMPFR